MPPIVRGIDHVFVVLDDVVGAHRTLAEELGLPVAWPVGDYGTLVSGGIGLGNANLELLRASDLSPWFARAEPARVRGIA
jgi:hypothetical protein